MLRIATLVIAVSAIVNATGWTQIPRGLVQVSGSLNYIWGINHDMSVHMCERPCKGDWIHIPGSLVQLDVDDQFVWGVNMDDEIFFRPIDGSGHWTKVLGHLTHVSTSGHGYVWGTNRNHNIFKCKKPCGGEWVKVDGLLKQVDGGEREVCGINEQNALFCRPVDASGAWRHVSDGFKYVSASGPYDIFAVSTSNAVFSCKKPCIGQWDQLGHNDLTRLVKCDATTNALFGVDANESIWRKDISL